MAGEAGGVDVLLSLHLPPGGAVHISSLSIQAGSIPWADRLHFHETAVECAFLLVGSAGSISSDDWKNSRPSAGLTNRRPQALPLPSLPAIHSGSDFRPGDDELLFQYRIKSDDHARDREIHSLHSDLRVHREVLLPFLRGDRRQEYSAPHLPPRGMRDAFVVPFVAAGKTNAFGSFPGDTHTLHRRLVRKRSTLCTCCFPDPF